jgi:peroxiredoxin Q/BCP
MADLQPGDVAPDFTLPTDTGEVRLADLKGRKVVVYFYPKDDTSGCTAEGLDFTAKLAAFEAAGATVIGVSKDSPKKHAKFRAKYDLAHDLGSDETGAMLQAYGSWVEKSMYGRKYMGIQRDTFLIDADGKIAQIWRKVKVTGHADEVLKAVKALTP